MDVLVASTQAHPMFLALYPPEVAGFAAATNENTAPAVVAIDCEMVCTVESPMELARVTVVGEHGESLLELLVRPSAEVLDWRSHISGCTAAAASEWGVPAHDARAAVRTLLGPGTIIVGHGLHHDFEALRLAHTRVVDTALLFPPAALGRSKKRMDAVASLPLRFLVHTLVLALPPEAFDSPTPNLAAPPPPHDSLEDARMALAVAAAAATAAGSGGGADVDAYARAPRFALPSRTRVIDVRGVPFDWVAHASGLVEASGGLASGGASGGATAGVRLLTALFDGALADLVAEVPSGGGGGRGGVAGNKSRRPSMWFTPPCFTFAQDAAPGAATDGASVDDHSASGDVLAPDTAAAAAMPLGDPPEVAHQAHARPPGGRAVVGAATASFACREDRDAAFDALLLRAGAARQVRLWPLPAGTSPAALRLALLAAGHGTASSVRVIPAPRPAPATHGGKPKAKAAGAPVDAGFVTFVSAADAYRSLGRALPSPPCGSLPAAEAAEAGAPPPPSRLVIELGGEAVALHATLARVNDFTTFAGGAQLHFFRR